MDAAFAWRVGGWHKWVTLHPLHRAKMFAFHLCKNLREAYSAEQSMKEDKPTGGKAQGRAYDQLMAEMH